MLGVYFRLTNTLTTTEIAITDLPNIFNHDKTYFLRLSEDMIGICEGAPDPKCAGAILSVFEYWTRVKLANREQAEIENTLAIKHGEKPAQDTTLWIYKNEEDLQVETLGLFGLKKLRDNRKWLIEEAGYLYSRNNPKYEWDRTLQYHVHAENVRSALSTWQNRRLHAAELPDGTAELPDRSGETAGAIPETTTETNNTETNDKSSVAHSVQGTDRAAAHNVRGRLNVPAGASQMKTQEPAGKNKEPEHALEKKIRELSLRGRNLSQKHRDQLRESVTFLPEGATEVETAPSPIELWDTMPEDYVKHVEKAAEFLASRNNGKVYRNALVNKLCSEWEYKYIHKTFGIPGIGSVAADFPIEIDGVELEGIEWGIMAQYQRGERDLNDAIAAIRELRLEQE